MEPGPTCQPQLPLNRPHRSLVHVRHSTQWCGSYRTSPVATTLRVAWHATLTLCSVNTSTKKSAILPVALELTHATTLLRPPLPPAALLAVASHRWAASVSSNRPKGAPWRSALLHRVLVRVTAYHRRATEFTTPSSSPSSSPSLAVVCAPPTASSLRGGSHDLIAHLRPHRRRPPRCRQPTSVSPSMSNRYQSSP
jgi:hypothetical protein